MPAWGMPASGHSGGTADLVRAAAAGDSASWDVLVDRFTPLMWSVARGCRLQTADAADAVAAGWLRLLEHLTRITDAEHLGAWLATTVRRECLRQISRAGREQPYRDEDLDVVDLTAPPVEASLLEAERDRELWAALEQLPDPCRLLLRLLMTDPPATYAEIGAAMGIAVGSIGPTRSRCLARLRARLEAGGITEDGRHSSSQTREEVRNDRL